MFGGAGWGTFFCFFLKTYSEFFKAKGDDVENENENEDKGDGSSAEPKEDMVDDLTKTEEENPKEKTAAQKKPKRKANKRVKSK